MARTDAAHRSMLFDAHVDHILREESQARRHTRAHDVHSDSLPAQDMHGPTYPGTSPTKSCQGGVDVCEVVLGTIGTCWARVTPPAVSGSCRNCS